MGTIKEISEDATIVIKQVVFLQKWLSTSHARVTFVMLLLGICLIGIQYWYLNDLLAKAQKNRENKASKVVELVKANGYQFALDAVELCLEAKRDETNLQNWYCEQAINQYKNASTDWPQDRVNEVTEKFAYGAMKSDLSHYMRSLQVDRVSLAPASEEEKVLELLLTNTMVVLVVVVLFGIMLGTYLVLWILPNRQRTTPVARIET